ncbi:hypothetical protein SAMN05216325_1202 [Nitrosomonas marina]|uniref:Uncharacterized protein n=1 Tax=Nitrosomonas marina TaxID=917 RepID=A0A1H8GVN9_9PROT|nr:hypothetical protein SAMN05216325_1202 [Nitrosomonas marina]
MTAQSIAKEWRLFLIEKVFVRNYRIASNLDGTDMVQNPILEKFLP